MREEEKERIKAKALKYFKEAAIILFNKKIKLYNLASLQ